MDKPIAQPLISIALCTYNGERYLAEQMHSLMAQTWHHLEIVVVDDNSSDGTVAMLEAFAQSDPRIKLHRNALNLGTNKNFDLAMSLCKGDFIAPCDQDDIWHPEKLALLHAHIGERLMAYCDSALINADGASMGMRVSDRLNMYEGDDACVFVFGNCVSGHAMLFRKELLAITPPMPGIKFHDWWLAYCATALGGIAYLHQPLVQYRQHGSAQTDISQKRKRTDRVNRTQMFHERGQWIAQLASFASPHQAYLNELARLWHAQTQQWFSWSIVRHLDTKADGLFFIRKRKQKWRQLIKMFWGLKLKQLVDPVNYPSTSP